MDVRKLFHGNDFAKAQQLKRLLAALVSRSVGLCPSTNTLGGSNFAKILFRV
jgi:hypothetical protein